jgi:ketosteroid isomerase-like protein
MCRKAHTMMTVSEGNVELVRSMLADFSAFNRVLAVLSPDFVWDLSTFEGWTGQTRYEGADAFIEFMRKWLEPYDEWQIESEEIVESGGGKVVATLRQTGRLRGSDSSAEMHYGIVYTVDGGQIRRAQVYRTPEEALESAAGRVSRP